MKMLQWAAAILLLVAMFSASKSAALPALIKIGRFLFPFILLWFVWKFLRDRVSRTMGKLKDQILDAAQQQQHARGAGVGVGLGKIGKDKSEVIDLCPQCGSLLAAGHVCVK
jgi:hypothetical protein